MKKRVNFTIEEHVLQKLDNMAKERGIDRSTMISILIYDSESLLDLLRQGSPDTESYLKNSFAK